MERSRFKTLIGFVNVALGIVQAGLFATQSEWVPTVFGIVFSLIGMLYLWAEVYTIDQ